MENRYGIATVTDEKYIRGTETLLYSFLKNNPWFESDIVIIHDQLQESCKKRLRYFPNTIFVQIDVVLKRKIGYLTNEILQLKNKSKMFYKFQVFNLTEYNKLLYLDSDMICSGNIRKFFHGQSPLKVCPDAGFYLKKVRDKKTYKLIDAKSCSDADVFKVTFNTGMMLIGKENLDEKVFHEMTGLINPENYKVIESRHADSVILNQYFCNRFTLAEHAFNYFLSNNSFKYKKCMILHYIMQPKPWRLKEIMKTHFLRAQAYPGFITWHKSYLGYLIKRRFL